jgi:polygalacturonase
METVKLFALLTLSAPLALGAALFDVREYGAMGDGRTKDTAAIAKAIAACSKAGGGTVNVPAGRYLTGPIVLKSHVTLNLDAGSTILASTDAADYPVQSSVWGDGRTLLSSVIYAEDAENITITGRGTIDGQGQVWWHRFWLAHPKKGMQPATTAEEKAEAAMVANGRPHLIKFIRCKDVVIEHVNLINSPEWTIHPMLSEFIRIDGVTIHNPVPSPNTDGINPESCRNVQILNSRIDVGDDCVTLKSGKDAFGRKIGMPDENITITNCIMLKGHGGVVIGSEMSGGVRNVVVTNCVFQGTDKGIRIKSQRGRGGVVEGLTVSNIVMQDVPSPFTITTFYNGGDKPTDVFPVNDGTPIFRDFHFSNITARGAKIAGEIMGLKEMPVQDITFTGIHIRATKGMTCTDAKGIAWRDVTIETAEGPVLTKSNCGIAVSQ